MTDPSDAEVDDDGAQEPEEETVATPVVEGDDAAATRRALPAWAWSAGVVLAVACIVLALFAVNERTALHRDRAERSAIENTASSFAVALTTYDYKDLPSWHDRVVGFATGGFRAEFDQGFTPLKELLATAQISSKGTVTDVFIKQVDANSARAFVQVSSTAAGVGGPRADVGSTIELSLVRSGGAWKVDDVKNFNTGTAAGSGPAVTVPAGAAPPAATGSSVPPASAPPATSAPPTTAHG